VKRMREGKGKEKGKGGVREEDIIKKEKDGRRKRRVLLSGGRGSIKVEG
jgi:hypothetical protein